MSLHHIAAWKVASAVAVAISATVIVMEPTVKVALIMGVSAIVTMIAGKLMERWFPPKILQKIATSQNEIKVSVDGNFKRMLDDKEKQDKLIAQSDKDLARAEGHREGSESERKP
jgi:hypothetical protein